MYSLLFSFQKQATGDLGDFNNIVYHWKLLRAVHPKFLTQEPSNSLHIILQGTKVPIYLKCNY